jgi:dipeptidase D
LVTGAGSDLAATLLDRVDRSAEVRVDIQTTGDTLRLRARGVAAHSSTPWEGRNALTHLAALLGTHRWPATPAATMVRLINDLVGTGHYAEQFGAVAYTHDFMGPLTLALTTLGASDGGGLVAGLNIRRPVGRRREEVEATIRATLDGWSARTDSPLAYTIDIGEPYHLTNAPHIPILLDIFRFYTGRDAAGPISIGGGTQARLFPNGLNFGPAMPDEPYTGHSEHEFMTAERLRLCLAMYPAALVELT